MKTRLLALVLACMMVLSVMPVVVFAEDAVCEFACKDGEHTLEAYAGNTEMYRVHKVVDPMCGKAGYTVYQCLNDGCSAYFVDSYKAPDQVTHELVLTDKGVTPTCQSEGRTPKYECQYCSYSEGGDKLDKTHNYVQVEGSTEPTADMCVPKIEFECTICHDIKVKENTNKAHVWTTVPEIAEDKKPYLNENGELVNGLATYTCTVCNWVKEVVIIAEHDCTLEKVDAVAATCITAGNRAYWQCTHPNCGKKYDAETNGNLLTDADVVIAVGDHDLTEVKATPASCNKDTKEIVPGTKAHWHCSICNKNFADKEATTEMTDTVDNEGHTWRELGYVEPTCDWHGGYRYICGVCGFTKENIVEKPLGHTGYDEKDEAGNYVSTNRNEIWTSCQEGGERTWDCGRCGEAQKEAVAKHGLKTATFPATCTRVEYSFQYCDICAAPATQPTSKTHTDGLVYDLTVNGVAYMIVGEVTFGTETNPANHNWVETPNKLPTCTTPGDSALHCADCEGIIDTKYIPAHHETKQGEPLAVVPASCTRPAYETYKCAVCGNNYDIESGEALDHAFGEPVEVAPTCAKDGYYRSTCTRTGCGEYKDEPSGKTKVAYVPAGFFSLIENDNGSAYANVENWKFQGYLYAIHEGADEETRKTIIKGDCENLGFYQYKCNDCGELIMVAIPGTGLGHQNDGIYGAGEVAPVEATCNADGTKGTYTCTVCGVTGLSVEPENMNKVPHSLTPVNTANHMKDYCQINYWSCSTCDTEKYSNLFTDAEGKNRVDGFQEHDKELLDSRSVSCENFGYKHYICLHENCRLEYIISYADALGHHWNKTEGKEPTCVEKGVEDLWQCDRDCCDVEGGKVHAEYYGKEIPATGKHKNAADETFTNECNDPTTDRVCVICKDYIERVHYWSAPVIVDATCQTFAYELKICNICYIDQVTIINEGVYGAHDLREEDWAPVEGNDNLERRYCRTQGCDESPDEDGKAYYEERRKADVEYFVEIENVLGDVGYTDSSLIAVTVKVKADAPLWGVSFDLNYDENLTFDSAKFVSENLDCGRAFQNHVTETGRFVRIAADASNTDDQQKTDVVLEGKEALIVVYFRVTLPIDDTTKLPVVGHEKTESVLTITPIDAINAKDEDLKAIFRGDVVDNAYTDTAKIEIQPFMNPNADCCINLKDIAYMHTLVIAAEGSKNYDVTLDINKDGEIGADDYRDLYKYYVGTYNYEQMTAIGVLAEEQA